MDRFPRFLKLTKDHLSDLIILNEIKVLKLNKLIDSQEIFSVCLCVREIKMAAKVTQFGPQMFTETVKIKFISYLTQYLWENLTEIHYKQFYLVKK